MGGAGGWDIDEVLDWQAKVQLVCMNLFVYSQHFNISVMNLFGYS